MSSARQQAGGTPFEAQLKYIETSQQQEKNQVASGSEDDWRHNEGAAKDKPNYKHPSGSSFDIHALIAQQNHSRIQLAAGDELAGCWPTAQATQAPDYGYHVAECCASERRDSAATLRCHHHSHNHDHHDSHRERWPGLAAAPAAAAAASWPGATAQARSANTWQQQQRAQHPGPSLAAAAASYQAQLGAAFRAMLAGDSVETLPAPGELSGQLEALARAAQVQPHEAYAASMRAHYAAALRQTYLLATNSPASATPPTRSEHLIADQAPDTSGRDALDASAAAPQQLAAPSPGRQMERRGDGDGELQAQAHSSALAAKANLSHGRSPIAAHVAALAAVAAAAAAAATTTSTTTVAANNSSPSLWSDRVHASGDFCARQQQQLRSLGVAGEPSRREPPGRAQAMADCAANCAPQPQQIALECFTAALGTDCSLWRSNVPRGADEAAPVGRQLQVEQARPRWLVQDKVQNRVAVASHELKQQVQQQRRRLKYEHQKRKRHSPMQDDRLLTCSSVKQDARLSDSESSLADSTACCPKLELELVVDEAEQQKRNHDEPNLSIETNSNSNSDDGGSQAASGGANRVRTAYSSMQILNLEREFAHNMYLSRIRRIELAQKLRLSEKQVKIWFQNRRVKYKKESSQPSARYQQSPQRSVA